MKWLATVYNFLKLQFQRNPFLFFVLVLLLCLTFLKVLFYYYNYAVVLDSEHHDYFAMIGWSLLYDLLVILFINTPFLFLLEISRQSPGKVLSIIIRIAFCVLNTFMLVLNMIDIFYFRFHFQRANLDLLYVTDHPLGKLANINFLFILIAVLTLVALIILIWKLQNLFYFYLLKKTNHRNILIVSSVMILLLILFVTTSTGKLVPTYPLINLSSKELSVVQNSMHTFAYSLYRNNHSLLSKKYFPDSFCDSALQIKKRFVQDPGGAPKNIVLFIMESIPFDFFDTSSRFKVAMPFLDSLRRHSLFFSNAYSYGLESNKGITSILAGIPTLTDIPLYHSSFINLPKTAIGKALKLKNYSSFFCIGDTYDNFGFAKCAYWLGFDKYYSERDMPGYNQLPAGPMGINDEYVLDFMQQKIQHTTEPFLAVNYNTTTHYPFYLPDNYKVGFPASHTNAMKSMQYYDSSLHKFFNSAKNEQWFQNAIFIFCSDHWGSPDNYSSPANNLQKFRIPILVYEPSKNEGKTDTTLASQFDVPGTVLSAAGYSDIAVSYGNNLLASKRKTSGGLVYNRLNDFLYQVIDSCYVLGFNVANDKTEYLHNYQADKNLKTDLKDDPGLSNIKKQLSDKIKIFYQKATMQYFNMPVK